jgi:hypothetical protein
MAPATINQCGYCIPESALFPFRLHRSLDEARSAGKRGGQCDSQQWGGLGPRGNSNRRGEKSNGEGKQHEAPESINCYVHRTDHLEMTQTD